MSIPQRTCVACRAKKDKPELIRIVKTPGGEILLDAKMRINARGSYICQDKECIAKARKKGALCRSLRVNVPEEFYAVLEGYIDEQT